MRSRLAIGLVGTATSLALLVPSAVHAAPPRPTEWVGSWHAAMTTAAPDGPSEEGFTDTTLRQVAQLSVGGAYVRNCICNDFGTDPFQCDSATVSTMSTHDTRTS